MTDFNSSLHDFLTAINDGIAKLNATMSNWPQGYANPVETEAGSKFVRVVTSTAGSRSCYCFVEKATGNILKSAGWKAPAKGARGNIYDAKSYEAARASLSTGWLYAR